MERNPRMRTLVPLELDSYVGEDGTLRRSRVYPSGTPVQRYMGESRDLCEDCTGPQDGGYGLRTTSRMSGGL